MLISDSIAAFIDEMLNDCGGTLEIKRNDLAKRLGCVPSQINYVVTSRFTPERGYIIESRRGGGGYIRIIRKAMSEDDILMKFFNIAKCGLTDCELESILETMYSSDIITAREARFIRSGLSQAALSSLPRELQNAARGNSFCNILLALMN
ncbi:MAG: CtsR family transcriptional regulator [Ruminococcaceae bacterium]|nr:CtsR family transcriptional regulator [Oscillospiraceae bacterium]